MGDIIKELRVIKYFPKTLYIWYDMVLIVYIEEEKLLIQLWSQTGFSFGFFDWLIEKSVIPE